MGDSNPGRRVAKLVRQVKLAALTTIIQRRIVGICSTTADREGLTHMRLQLRPGLATLAVGFDALARGLNSVLRAIVLVLTLSFVAVALAAVVFRYVLNDSLIWSEEYIRYSLFWTVMLGAALVSYENGHLHIEVVHELVPKRVSWAITKLAHLLSITFCVVLVWQACVLFQRTTGVSPALRLPMRAVYAAMIVGGAAMIIMTINVMITGRRAPTEEIV